MRILSAMWRWWRTPWYLRRSSLDRIAETMYYEQAERDGCEYPPQWRGW